MKHNLNNLRDGISEEQRKEQSRPSSLRLVLPLTLPQRLLNWPISNAFYLKKNYSNTPHYGHGVALCSKDMCIYTKSEVKIIFCGFVIRMTFIRPFKCYLCNNAHQMTIETFLFANKQSYQNCNEMSFSYAYCSQMAYVNKNKAIWVKPLSRVSGSQQDSTFIFPLRF